MTSDLKKLVGLITVLLDSTPGQTYVCGHYHGEVRLVGGVMPSIVIWGHTVHAPIQPRVMDMQSAKEFRSLAKHELDSIGVEGTERYGGNHADWRVKLPDDE